MCSSRRLAVVIRASRQRRVFPRLICFSSALALALATATSPSLAGNGLWSSTATSGTWQITGNWVAGSVPGATSGTTNTDSATFNSTSSTTTIVPDLNRNLKNITFDTNAAAYTIGTTSGNSLLLSSGGGIVIGSTFSGSHLPETINAPLALEGNYTFTDNDPTHTDLLGFGGAISSGTAGTQTLTVNGSADTQIDGAIGGGTGTIALAMNGTSTGRLFLGGNNTFTGGVTINSGTIVLNNGNALGSAVPTMNVASGATLDLGQQFVIAGPALTIQGTGVNGFGALVASSTTPAGLSDAINPNVDSSFSVGGFGPITLSGGFNNIGGQTTLTYGGSSVLTLSGPANNANLSLIVNSGTVILAKTSSPTVHAVGGAIMAIFGGTVQLAGTGGDQIPDNSVVEVHAGAAFETNGRTETILDLYLSGTGINGGGALVDSASGASVITTGFGNTSLTTDSTIGVTQLGAGLTLNSSIGFANFATGNKAITKVGLGTLILNGGDFYTGPINVNAGTLMLNGGSVAGDVVNAATFVFAGTSFGGRLTNTGIATLNVDFAPGNGMENDGVVSVAAGVNLALSGAGLLNTGSLSMTGGTLTLSSTGTNTNSGSIGLSSSARLNVTGTTFTNTGMLSLDGALVSGAGGTLVNAAGGNVSGTGTINCAFSNTGGLLAVGSGAFQVTQAFTNGGVIQLTSLSSNLSGGAITNTNMIQGLGNIESAITNNGTIQPLGGSLFVGGGLTNSAGGLLTAGAGNELFVTAGLAVNPGIINLTGGIYDNGGHALNNTGQISGWGIFRTGGTGLDNNGSITFSGGLTTINGPVTNEGGKTITVAQNNAIFTGLVTNNMNATFNTINATATFAGGFTNNGNSNFAKAGGGVVEVDVAPTLNNSSTLSVTSGTLRFNVVSGTPTIGTAVTATVSSGATLELAGSVSALANGANRVNITNNSNAPGILVSGTHQQVGNIDGSGTTQVNAGSDVTANHIVQGALVIGGTSKSFGLVTIDASDALGNPLSRSSGLALADSLTPNGPFGAADTNSASLSAVTTDSTDLAVPAAGNSVGNGNASQVPEPPTLVLVLLAILALYSTHFARNHFRCQTV
jgi:fibronectin-binding autotransporter adhesin